MTTVAAVRFLSDRVLTASPAQRVVMLYDRALLDLDRAEAAERAEDASSAVMHAVAVVAELQAALDVTVWDGATSLADLYTWCLAELFACRDGSDVTRLGGVRTVLRDLRDAWSVVAAGPQPVATGRTA